MDRVLKALWENDGAARRSELLAAGVTRHDLVSAVRTGAVLRPARGILALPDADPLLVRCLTTNSLLTCVSAARTHGLWVLKEHEEIHLQRPDGRLASDRAVVHRGSWAPPPPAARTASVLDTVMHVEPQVLVEGVGWMDHIVERCLDLEVDGKTHQQPASRYSDYVRDGAAQARGFATLRVSYADVVHRTAQMVRRVSAVVSTRLGRGSLPVY